MPYELIEAESESSGFEILEPEAPSLPGPSFSRGTPPDIPAEESEPSRIELRQRLQSELEETRADNLLARAFASPESIIPPLLLPPEDPGSLENILRKLPLGAGEDKDLREDRVKGISSALRAIEGGIRSAGLPENLPLIPLAGGNLPRLAMGALFGGEALGAGAGQASVGFEQREPETAGAGVGTALLGGALATPLARRGLELTPSRFDPAAMEEARFQMARPVGPTAPPRPVALIPERVEPVTPEVPRAERITEPTEIHGDLRTRAVEGAKEMPAEEGRGGIRPDIPQEPAAAGEGVLGTLNAEQAIQRIESMPPEAAARLNQKAESYSGMTFTPEDVPALTRARQVSHERSLAAMEALMKDPDNPAMNVAQQAEMGRNIWLSGAIEIANKRGPNYEAMRAEMEAPKAEIETKAAAESKPISEPEITLVAELGGEPLAKAAEPTIRKYFTAQGSLPDTVFADWVTREGSVREQANVVKHNVKDLYQALRAQYGIGKGQQFVRGFKDVPETEVQNMNAALKGELPIESLPEPVRGPIQKLRNHIDQLSATMLAEGLIPDKLAAVIGNNLGVYVTRSYRVFDDPKWAQNIPEDVRNRARVLIRQRMQEESEAAHERAVTETREAGVQIPAEAPRVTDDQAEATMRSMLEEWRESGESRTLFGKGARLGSKDLTLFMRRKDIDPEIRALMGEYDSPVINYVKSISKMSRFIADQTFLNRVRIEGMGKFLFEAPQGEFVNRIAADESRVMSPLNGLYTSRPIADAFREFGRQSQIQNPFWKFLMGLNAASKAAKTVFSLMTQARNLIGQPFFNLMSGHWNFSNYSPSFKAIAADIGLKSDAQFQAYYREMLRRGIAHESAPASELRAAIQDAGLSRLDTDMDAFTGKQFARSLRRGLIDAPQRAYAISDELGKIMGFENEKNLVRRAFPNWTDEQVATEAAKRVRNQYPTYSMVPEWIRLWRRQPFFGPFVTFGYETFRTTFHALNQTRKELGSGNPRERSVGAQRLAGQMTVLAGAFILSALTKSLFGIDEEEEDDLRLFLPHWQRNSKFAYVGRDKGQLSFIDLSYIDPYSYLTDPIVAVAANDEKSLLGKTARAFGELIAPFANEQILSGAVIDVMRNQTREGRPVYNPQDTDQAKFDASLKHVVRALEPGTVDRIVRRIVPAVTGQKSETGREYKPLTEIGSELTGIRTQNFDYGQALSFAARKFVAAENEAESIFRSVATRRGIVTEKEILKAWQRSDGVRRQIYDRFKRQFDAAQRRGVPEEESVRILRSANVPQNIIGQIRANQYVPYLPSAALTRRMGELERKAPYQSLRELYEKSQGPILTKER